MGMVIREQPFTMVIETRPACSPWMCRFTTLQHLFVKHCCPGASRSVNIQPRTLWLKHIQQWLYLSIYSHDTKATLVPTKSKNIFSRIENTVKFSKSSILVSLKELHYPSMPNKTLQWLKSLHRKVMVLSQTDSVAHMWAKL